MRVFSPMVDSEWERENKLDRGKEGESEWYWEQERKRES